MSILVGLHDPVKQEPLIGRHARVICYCALLSERHAGMGNQGSVKELEAKRSKFNSLLTYSLPPIRWERYMLL